MYTKAERDMFIDQFTEKAYALFEKIAERCNIDVMMENNDPDGVVRSVETIQEVMIGSIPEGIAVPKVTRYVSSLGADESISVINIRLTNRVNSDKKWAYPFTAIKGNATKKVFDFMLAVYTALIVDILVSENLVKVNDVIMQLTAEAGVEYGIRVVSALGADGNKIKFISDDEIVFVADEERAFELDDIVVLLDGATDTVSEDMIQANYMQLVEELRTAQTTTQLVGMQGGLLIAYVCDISKRIKPITLIKKVSSKNVFKLTSSKDTVAYYNKDKVFALIAQRGGMKEVILSPFDVDTLANVDVDVLAEVSAELA